MNQTQRQKAYDLLDEDQHEVVTHEGGDCIVLAGAGSGKTRCMQHRVSWLLDQQVRPRSIVALSFTRKASQELSERICALHPQGRDIISRTFHSLCYHILQQEGFSGSIIDNRQAARFVAQSFAEVKWRSEEPASYAVSLFNRPKNLALPEQEFPSFWLAADRELGDQIRRLYALYEAHKTQLGLIDFADMQYRVWKLLLEDGEPARRMREQFEHLIVDEVQDLNPLQIQIANFWSAHHRNAMLVGDIRQSMYGFRGASIKELLGFSRERSMKTLYLRRNYRSGSDIVHLSNDMIAEGLIERDLPPCSPVRPDSGRLRCFGVHDQYEEGDVVARMISNLIAEGESPDEIACLYRVNAQAQYLEMSLGELQVPYYVQGAVSFFDRKEVKDAVAYLRLAVNLADVASLSRVYNTPGRYLGKAFYRDFLNNHQEGATVFAGLSATARQMPTFRARSVHGLISDLKELQGLADFGASPVDILERVYEFGSTVDKKKTFYDLYRADDGSDSSRTENLDSLKSLASRFSSTEEFLASVEESEASESQSDPDQPRVQLMSVHRSKGLEFKHVFVVGFADGLFPHRRGDLEEERRVAYVAMTRAADEVVFTTPSRLYGKPAAPSPFLDHLGLAPEPHQ